MLNREAEEKLAEILVQRIEKVNADVLTEIGRSLKKISTLSGGNAKRLQQVLRYGGDYNKIARILAKISGRNVQDIYKIFKEVAKTNKEFARQFYDYRNIAFIPYEQDRALQRQVMSMAEVAANELYKNLSHTKGVGLIVDNKFKTLPTAYDEIIDKGITAITQGKKDFYSAMRDVIKEVGGHGLVLYESGRTRRLDSAVRMNLMDGMRMVSNETNRRFGEEYGADGTEITVHEFSAPDHEDAQGMQFKNEEFAKLQETGVATTVDNVVIDLHRNAITGKIGKGYRPISQLNCYHRTLNIVVGVSLPQYTKEQLQQFKERNRKGFEFEGKHYTMYEGTQLQRQLETAIRKNKDVQILARESGDTELASKTQIKINKLTDKYDRLNKASGLSPKNDRTRVSGYRKIKTYKANEIIYTDFSQWRNSLTENEERAVVNYGDTGYVSINEHLRGNQIADVETKKDINYLKSAGNKFELDKPETLYRHDAMRFILPSNNLKDNIGKEIELKSFTSTSYKKEHAVDFFQPWDSEDACLLEINAPKGTKGVPILTDVNNEYEFLLLPNSKFKIKDIYKSYGYNRYDKKVEFIKIVLDLIKEKK